MPCYHPLKAWRLPEKGPLRFYTSNQTPPYGASPVTIPCGQCIGCRLAHSRMWAVRCMHESSLHEDNSFITLTYNDRCLPYGSTLVVKHMQDFMKRFRYYVDDKFNKRIRHYYCGEYGPQTFRPHYHALIFGFDFPDKEFKRTTRNGHRIYTSKLLDKAWGFGNCEVGSVDYDSAAYCARYVVDKITGDVADFHYKFVDKDGVIYDRIPEFSNQSRRPGIAAGWYEKFYVNIFPRDYVVVNGIKLPPPRYYEDRLKKVEPTEFEWIKNDREIRSIGKVLDNSPSRLATREEVVLRRLNRLSRSL